MTKSGANPYSGKAELKEYHDRILEIDDEIGTIMGKALNDVKVKRGEQKDVLDEASENGINRRALKAVVKESRLLAKIDAIPEDLEEGDKDHFDWMRQELGQLEDTPLGQAAVAAAETARADQSSLAKVGRGKNAASADPSLN